MPLLLSREEFHRVAEALPDRSLELIYGQVEMIAKGTRHSKYVSLLTAQLSQGLQVLPYQLRVECPLWLSPDSEPEPDLVVVQARQDWYAEAHPTAADTLLVIEVSDTTLERDRTEKLALYRDRGIPHYWIVNLIDNRLEQWVFQNVPLPESLAAIAQNLTIT